MTTPLHKGADAAFPGAPLPPGTEILAAYVGIPGQGNQSPDTPHIWTAAEWNRYIDLDPDLRLLPIYVHNYDDGNPTADAKNAIDAVRSLGWAPDMPAPGRRFIVVDQETFVDPAYFYAMGQEIWNAGFRCVPYGSRNAVLHNPPFAGPWVADYNYSHPPTMLPADWRGIQWRAGGAWDLNVFDHELYLGCGVGTRHG